MIMNSFMLCSRRDSKNTIHHQQLPFNHEAIRPASVGRFLGWAAEINSVYRFGCEVWYNKFNRSVDFVTFY